MLSHTQWGSDDQTVARIHEQLIRYEYGAIIYRPS